jgi:hypothetical protein
LILPIIIIITNSKSQKVNGNYLDRYIKILLKWQDKPKYRKKVCQGGRGAMPKKFSIINKREWLKAYEDGTPEATIAKNKCDIRTVQKGIEEARLEQDSRTARADLIKEALRKHNESLLATIDDVMSVLIPMPARQHVPGGSSSGSLPINGGKAQYELWPEPRVFSVTLDAEDRPEWDLLWQHIKRDRLRDTLTQWKKTLTSHLQARMVLRQRLESLLRQKTGYEFAEKPASGAYLDTDGVSFLLEKLLDRISEPVTVSDFENMIVADPRRGEVTYGRGLALAHAPGKEEECREAIIAAIAELLRSDEWISVLETFRRIKESATKARQAAEEIRLLGLLPGRCRICSRLGT